MIIGRIEGLCSHSNDIVHTGGINQREATMLRAQSASEEPISHTTCESRDVLPVQQFMLDGFQMNQREVVLHEPEQLDLTFVVRMVDDKQVNGVIWSETSGESINKDIA